MVKLLIEYGATAKHIDETGWSPLIQILRHYRSDSYAIVELLIGNGANINFSESNTTPIWVASAMRPQKYTPGKGNAYDDVYDEDIAIGITDIVKLLAENGADINAESTSGFTVLMNASYQGNLPLVVYLLEIGADKTAKDEKGKTAYDYAMEREKKEIAKLLKL